MHPSFIRRDLGTLIPPKIATPNSLVRLSISGGISLLILLTTFLRHIYLIYHLNVDSNFCSHSTIPLENIV